MKIPARGLLVLTARSCWKWNNWQLLVQMTWWLSGISGIYGPGRERLIRLAVSEGFEVQQSPAFFTNRIHRDDAAAALRHLLLLDKPDALYIASDDQSAPRYDVVKWLAEAQGATAPAGLTDEHANRGKRVSNQRLRGSGFILTYPDYRAGYGAVLKAGVNRTDPG